MAEDPTTLGSESKALEALKVRVNDPACPPLTLARQAKAHLIAYPQSIEQLAAKLGKSRPWLSQLLGFLDLPEEVLAKAEAEKAGFYELQQLRTANPSAKNKTNATNGVTNAPTNATNAGTNATNGPTNATNVSENNETNATNTPTNAPSPGYPLLRDTVNAVAHLVFFWAKDSKLGELAEQWALRLQLTGWARGVGILLLWGLAGYGSWHLVREIRARAPVWVSRGQAAGRGPASFLAAPAPQLTGQRWISGHRLELHWNPAGANHRYRIYRASENGKHMRPLAQEDVRTPGAIVQVSKVRGKVFLSVTAINPQDEESAYSAPVEFDPLPVNDQDSVEPLPLEGTPLPAVAGPASELKAQAKKAGAPGAQPKAPGAALAPPSEVHIDILTPDLIRLSWRAVSKEARYNVYSSGSRRLTALRKENTSPLKSNLVDWTPETGLERYWVVVTTLDAQDRESVYSEAIEVVRHPEKSGPSAADEAAGALRKVLPW
ncbi:MAG: hypothetical protein A2992_00255 [Elusimicrobia bacterium RIFCSPLOWO2_01_FULL_59_12]|nr:MAG: hypothetical protein A2992_00255 [Elusimicrobia bacterium RIFCSPLOWO2_01_FULL_59_12]